MQKNIGNVFVWPLCTRIIHWIIAISFLASFTSSFFHDEFIYHIAFGYVFGIVLTFRIIWGFIGPQYATFNTFMFQASSLKHYFQEKVRDRWRKIHPGHNPASSWFTLIVLSLGYAIVLGGILLYGVQEGNGPVRFLNPSYFHYSNFLLYIHRYMSYILFIWALIHIVGVLIEQFYHRTNMVCAMITGYKRCVGVNTQISALRNSVAYGVIVFVVFSFYFIVSQPENTLTQSRFEPIDFEKENPAFYEKCGNCHKNYPPYMLPKESWVKLFDGLENHFGEKITENNISKEMQVSIKSYVLANSAEYSSRKISFKTLESLGEMRPLSITKSPYWREVHHPISNETFKSTLIKNKSNCFACHHGFEKGIFDITFIHVPK